MRIPIREQLAGFLLFTSLVPLAVLAIATWINNHNFVTDITSQSLSLAASLKATQIASDLLLIQATCATIVTRILLQNALKAYYRGNQLDTVWTQAERDVRSALRSGGYSSLLQIVVFSRNSTTDNGVRGSRGLLSATLNTTTERIMLPDRYDNGTLAVLGDDSVLGYPAKLYPNISYTARPGVQDDMDSSVEAVGAAAFGDFPFNKSSALLLGPYQVNRTFALVSLTLPIVDSSNDQENVLGYMTVVAAATSLLDVTTSRAGLANTGIVLLISTSRPENLFTYERRPANGLIEPPYVPAPGTLDMGRVKYVFPPVGIEGQTDRHSAYNKNLTEFGTSNFSLYQYPAALAGFGKLNRKINNASSILTTKNENNASVAVGYARPQSTLVNWLLIVEQTHEEAWAPIERLRTIVLACVFGTVGLLLIVVLPMAHYSVRPIRRLRDATEKSISPPGYTPNGSLRSERVYDDDRDDAELSGEDEVAPSSQKSNKKNFFIRLRNLGTRRKTKEEHLEEQQRRTFKIPAKVRDRKHFITDELTELTKTFNDMSDELMLQYQSLEQKVAVRTHELEISKKAAEAANESKTLFIANISHELKTPLNGILGMCAVCMGEDDLPRIKRSLQIVYKSGDLLLHLLNDLLTFSKNQIGQQLSLEEKEFRLSDIKVQIVTIFMKQVKEGNIDFSVKFINFDAEVTQDSAIDSKVLPALGPNGAGRLKDMSLWGDQHRILQVVINLVSNSLKFTPEGGKVEVRIKCLGEAETSDGSRQSMGSKQSSRQGSRQGSQRNSRPRQRHDSASNTSQMSKVTGSSPKPAGTALLINPMDPSATPRVQVRERSPTPPPSNARTLLFQFEVQDTGPGIPESLREKVFEPFVQADLGLSKKFGGTGLGLSICSQLASLMGGKITLDSAEGVGSTFTMVIPLKHVRSRAPSTSSSDAQGISRPGSISSTAPIDGLHLPQGHVPGDASPKPGFEKDPQPRLVGLSVPFFASAPVAAAGKDTKEQLAVLDSVTAGKKPERKLRVLVAEDNLVNQEVVLRMLKLESVYDVVVAKDGQEAYDMVKASMSEDKFFDLIFMDIQMPNLDGLQSTRLIRQMGYSAPIVALTAFSEESNVKECYDSGMDHFLSKPIRRPALKQVLKKFATIIEEAETASIMGKNTPPDSDGRITPPTDSSKENKDLKDASKANGNSHASSSTTP